MKTAEVTVRKAPDDPTCTRVSVGGTMKIGYYCTYRGSVQDSIECLENALTAMRAMREAKMEAPLSNIRGIGEQGRS
jgi:hypothetical protein